MSNNPTATLTRPQVHFCLANRELKLPDGTEVSVICTRIDQHKSHCCDEITGLAWNDHSSKPVKCAEHHNHSKEKGLCR